MFLRCHEVEPSSKGPCAKIIILPYQQHNFSPLGLPHSFVHSFSIIKTGGLTMVSPNINNNKRYNNRRCHSFSPLASLVFFFISIMVVSTKAFSKTTTRTLLRHQERVRSTSRRPSSCRPTKAAPPSSHLLLASATADDDISSQPKLQHLVLVGGGHAHVQVIKALHVAARPEHLHVTLIDPQAAATYSGKVPACIIASAGSDDAAATQQRETQIDIAALATWAGIEFVHDRVVGMDLEQRLVYLRNRDEPIPYDAVSVDIGSTTRDLDIIPGARKYTIPTRPIDQLVHRLQQRAATEHTEDSNNDDAPPRLVVVGGGVAGLELCFSVHALFQQTHKDGRRPHTTLLHAGETLLPDESKEVRRTLYRILDDRGIVVQHNSVVERVEEHRVVFQRKKDPRGCVSQSSSEEVLPFDHCIWATGAAAHPLAWHLQERRGLQGTRHGWIMVQETLQSTSHPDVFAAGDCAHVVRSNGQPSPPKAGVYAVRAGPILVENLTRYLEYCRLQAVARNDDDDATTTAPLELEPYVPQEDFLKLIVCGPNQALGLRFGLAFYGKWVFDMKHAIDNNFMNLFQDLPADVSTIQRGCYDTSQYDDAANDPLQNMTLATPTQAAELIQRTDDQVDYKQAWLVLRTMAQNVTYRQDVLEAINDEQKKVSQPSKKQKQILA
eukprot:scaffold1029_cov194-Amphora_coffeaeformis.AAC.13